MRKKEWLILGTILLGALLTGCQTARTEDTAKIQIPMHERIEYNTVEVQRGTLEPEFRLKLTVDTVQVIPYKVEEPDLVVEKVHVVKGQHVKKGDVLISFEAKELQEEIKQLKEQQEEDAELLAHYKKLKKIAKSDKEKAAMYQESIDDITKELKYLRLQLSEKNEALSYRRIVAKEDGVISEMDDGLLFHFFDYDGIILTETCGSDKFRAQTNEDYDFQIGTVYQAVEGVASYDVKLVSVGEKTVQGARELLFEPVSDMSGVPEGTEFKVTVKKPKLEDVVYVANNAIHEVDGRYYVYVVDENGFRTGVEVKTGITYGVPPDLTTVILEGLSGGEKVVGQ